MEIKDKLLIKNDCVYVTDSGNIKINNHTLKELKQKLINYLYDKDPSIYSEIDYVLLQWITVRED